MTLFDAVYGASAVPSLFEEHGDSQPITVTKNDGTVFTLTAIIRAGTDEYQNSEEGLRTRISRCSIVICRAAAGGYSGMPDVHATDKVVIDGKTWAIDDEIGKGIQAKTGELQEVFLVRTHAVRLSNRSRNRQ